MDVFPIAMALLFDASQCFTREFLEYFRTIFVIFGKKQMAINIMANYNVIGGGFYHDPEVHDNVWFAFQNISFENIDCVIAYMQVNNLTNFVNHPMWKLAFKVVQKTYMYLEHEYISTNNGVLKEQRKMCMNQVRHVIELLRYYRKNTDPMGLQKCQYLNPLPIVEYIKFAISVIKQTTPRISNQISIQQSMLEKKQAEMSKRLRYKNVYQCCNDNLERNEEIVTKLGRLPNNGFQMLPDVISLMIIEYVQCYVINITTITYINGLTRWNYKTTCCCAIGSEESKLILK
jgi:hypothetical protein